MIFIFKSVFIFPIINIDFTNGSVRVKMACILAERLRESGVKLAKKMSCQMQGMAKRKLLCSTMNHTGSIVKTLRKYKIAIENQTRRTSSTCSTHPRIVTSSNVSTANVISSLLR